MSIFRRSLAIVLLAVLIQSATAQDWRTTRQLPGVDLSGLSFDRQSLVLNILREEDCPCGCKMKLAQCRVDDEECPKSPILAKLVTDAARKGYPAIAIRSSVITEQPPDRMAGTLTMESVRAVALSRHLNAPYFEFPPQRNRGIMRYGFGPDRDGRGGPIRIEYRRPLSIAVDLQRTIEELRKFRRNDFWKPYLRKAEAVVRKQIEWLNSGRDPNDRQLNQQLYALAAEGYGILDGAVQTVARDYGWQLDGPRPPAPKAAPEFSHLDVTIRPQGARLYYATEIEFRAMARLGLKAVRDINRNWIEVRNYKDGRTTIPQSGKVRFYVVWPNGREDLTLRYLRKTDPVKPPYINRISIGTL